MARFEVNGIAELCNDLAALAQLPDHVVDEILEAEADVIVRAQREEIAHQWSGPYSAGISAKCIKKGKTKKSPKGHVVYVSPAGTRKRGNTAVRNAEIAFLNEYGVSGTGRDKNHRKKTGPKKILPRPAIRTANIKAESAAVEAGEKVYHAYLDSKNL